MAEGYGFAGEGDWKTAALVRSMKVMAAGLPNGTSFMEDYTYHLNQSGMKVLGSHMLEICPTIATGKPKLEIHPRLADQHGIQTGDWVTVTTRRGAITLQAMVVRTIRPDTVFIPYHWPDDRSANVLTHRTLDPRSKIPEYKVSACRIGKAAGGRSPAEAPPGGAR